MAGKIRKSNLHTEVTTMISTMIGENALDSADFNSILTSKTTDDIAEGSNLYYTTTRGDSDFDTRLATKTTDNLTEGANLYWTTARGNANFATNLAASDTDDLSEGSTNLYYTSARVNTDFDTRLATKSTDNLTEGSNNLYFTNERVDDRVNSLLTAGTGITLSYNDGNNSLTISGSAQYGDSDVASYISGSRSFGNITTTGYIAGPSTFTIDPAAVGDNTGTVVIAGDLQVDGTTTTINSTTVSINDKNIVLADSAANASEANGAGITVNGASATITYNAANDEWDFNKTIDVTGNIKVSGTVDGVDVATRDGILTSTTTTANAALPKAGGQMTGNITFSGSQTVDGRDLSVDGSKLDGIESGATGDQTASEILTLIKTVDGSGSGLDADTLDGLNSGEFMRNQVTYSSAYSSDNDNINGIAFLRITGGSNAAFGGHHNLLQIPNSGSSQYDVQLAVETDADPQFKFRAGYGGTGNNWSPWRQIWHDGNDGSGSGLDADLLDGVQGSSYLRSDQNDSTTGRLSVDYGANSTAANLSEAHTIYAFGIQNRNGGSRLNFSGNSSYTSIQASSSTTAAEDISLNPFGGNVGIGTTSPDRPLHILAATNNAPLKIDTSDGTQSCIAYAMNGTDYWYAGVDLNANGGEDYFIYDANAGTNRLLIDNSGNVGIGTTSPSYKLDVSGEVRTTSNFRANGTIFSNRSGNSTTSPNLFLGPTTNNATRWHSIRATQYAHSSEGEGYGLIGGASNASDNEVRVGGGLAEENASTMIRFFTAANTTTRGGTERIRINSAGNVGIGTTSPDSKLEVSGSGNQQIKVTRTNESVETVVLSQAGEGWIGTQSNHPLKIGTGYTQKMFLSTDGKLGIGTTTPSYKLHVVGEGYFTDLRVNDDLVFEGNGSSRILGNGELEIYGTGTGTNIEIGTTASATSYPNSKVLYVKNGNASEIFTVQNNGKVGIGATSPAQALEVVGQASETVRLRSNANTGSNYLSFYHNSGNRQGYIGYGSSGNNKYYIVQEKSDNIEFYTGGSTKMYLSTAGDLTIGGGTRFINNPTSPYEFELQSSTNGSNFYRCFTIQNNDEFKFWGNSGASEIFRLDYSATYEAQVFGDLHASGNIISASDERLKTNIKPIENAIDKVKQIDGVTFNKEGDDQTSAGVIAQQVEKVLPEVVRDNEDGYKSVAYGNMVGLLIEAVKEQQKQIDLLKEMLENK